MRVMPERSNAAHGGGIQPGAVSCRKRLCGTNDLTQHAHPFHQVVTTKCWQVALHHISPGCTRTTTSFLSGFMHLADLASFLQQYPCRFLFINKKPVFKIEDRVTFNEVAQSCNISDIAPYHLSSTDSGAVRHGHNYHGRQTGRCNA